MPQPLPKFCCLYYTESMKINVNFWWIILLRQDSTGGFCESFDGKWPHSHSWLLMGIIIILPQGPRYLCPRKYGLDYLNSHYLPQGKCNWTWNILMRDLGQLITVQTVNLLGMFRLDRQIVVTEEIWKCSSFKNYKISLWKNCCHRYITAKASGVTKVFL